MYAILNRLFYGFKEILKTTRNTTRSIEEHTHFTAEYSYLLLANEVLILVSWPEMDHSEGVNNMGCRGLGGCHMSGTLYPKYIQEVYFQ